MKKLILIVAMIACMTVAKAENFGLQNTTLMMPPHIEFRDWGVYGIVEYDFVKCMSWNASMTNESVPMPTYNAFTGVLGFQFRRQTGVGVGFSYLHDASAAFTQLPVFIEFRSNYLRSRLTPFTALQVGYSFPIGSYQSFDQEALYISEGGLMFGLQVGARYSFTRNFGISLNVGYMLLHSNAVGYNDAYMTPAELDPLLTHNLKAGLALNF